MLKKNAFPLSLLVGSLSTALSLSAFADTDPCASFADLTTKSSANTFVGYAGGAASAAQAEQNARIALATNIRQKISATSTVVEDNKNSSLDASSQSVVSEVLIGAKVVRRCSQNNQFSAVVSLDKATFLSSIENRLASQITEAQKLAKNISTAKGDERLAQAIDRAKKFLSTKAAHFQDDLNVCQVYEGCKNFKSLETGVFDHLTDLVEKNVDKDQYVFETSGDVTEKFKDDIITLLENDNIHTVSPDPKDAGSKSTRRIKATCRVNPGSTILGGNRVVETRCVVEGFSGTQKMFRNIYSCKAMGDNSISADEASDSCRGRLLKSN